MSRLKNLIPAGETGASAYEIWASAQPEGADKSEDAFLKYMQGKPGKSGENGANGLSAYEIWADAQDAGADTSEQTYLAFQEGKQGEDGENGASAYDLWVIAQPEGADTSEEAFIDFIAGKPGKDGQDGKDGLSAYQIWVGAQEEGADTSEEAYLAFQVGTKGDDGASAYQIWLNAGNEGSEDDFLKWLQVTASVEFDPSKTNLLKSNSAGLFVNGIHPVIPKFSSSTLTGLLDTFKSMADGTSVYTMTANLANPLGIASLGGISVQRYISAEPQYFFTNEKGQYIPAQYFISGTVISAATVKVTVSVIMTDKPHRSWDLATMESVAIVEEGSPLQCKLSMRLLVGTTPSQNGMS